LKKSLKNHQSLKDIDFSGKLKIKVGNDLGDEGYVILNEILLENKSIRYLRLGGSNNITPKGYLNLKESIFKNNTLQEIDYDDQFDNFEKTDILNNELDLIYKLLILSSFSINFDFSDNIYLFSPDNKLKLNYLVCYIDKIQHLFFNFHHFDIIISYENIKKKKFNF
jgi:hypothetical protein